MKTAIVLFNLGGPDRPEAVKPFLFNLFNDRAIINLPQPFRWLVAKLISTRRAPVAQEIYAHLGGKSPLLDHTKAQAQALEQALGTLVPELGTVKSFIAMRYWHPRADECAASVRAWHPDQIILVPLYPQFSTTTTQSSVTEWHKAAKFVELKAPTKTLCCYPEEPGFINAMADLVAQKIDQASEASDNPYRLLLSAHGLPQKVVDGGDPYQKQVERTGNALIKSLAQKGYDNLDSVICYQSRVGPLEWIGPSTDDEVIRAGKDQVSIVMVPIAFVSEHSETLVELDIEYQELADEHKVPHYFRASTVLTEDKFINGLADQVRKVAAQNFVCDEKNGCGLEGQQDGPEKLSTFLASGMH
ncbi:MAG: ferrochelatase [Alphaproteobacteria bacterium]